MGRRGSRGTCRTLTRGSCCPCGRCGLVQAPAPSPPSLAAGVVDGQAPAAPGRAAPGPRLEFFRSQSGPAAHAPGPVAPGPRQSAPVPFPGPGVPVAAARPCPRHHPIPIPRLVPCPVRVSAVSHQVAHPVHHRHLIPVPCPAWLPVPVSHQIAHPVRPRASLAWRPDPARRAPLPLLPTPGPSGPRTCGPNRAPTGPALTRGPHRLQAGAGAGAGAGATSPYATIATGRCQLHDRLAAGQPAGEQRQSIAPAPSTATWRPLGLGWSPKGHPTVVKRSSNGRPAVAHRPSNASSSRRAVVQR